MPSTSPGIQPFTQVSPGHPTTSLQSLATFAFRHRRYVAYISGRQLNILSSPNTFLQGIQFQDELVAIVAEPLTGKLAVASRGDAFLLEPVTEGWAKIWWEKSLFLRSADQTSKDGAEAAQYLSWGNDGEVLLGRSTEMSLFSTLPSSRTDSPAVSILDGADVEVRRPVWSKSAAAPLQHAQFSPSAGLIATAGPRDRLVKIWRRLSYEEGLFDYSYLPHQGTVTHLEWRSPDHSSEEHGSRGIGGRHDDQPDVLYTVATDGILRVWTSGNMHDPDILMLYTSVDLVSAIPASPTLTVNGAQTSAVPIRYVFFLASDQFCDAIASSIGLNLEGKLSHTLEHLKELGSVAPDVVVTLDGNGRMSAWGLQTIGHKRRPESEELQQTIHIAHSEGFPLRLTGNANVRFATWVEDTRMHVLVHEFGRDIQWWQASIESFFSPSAPAAKRIERFVSWTGQNTPISELRASGGADLLSWSSSGQVAMWRLDNKSSDHQADLLGSVPAIRDAVVFGSGKSFATLELNPLVLVLRDDHGTERSRVSVGLDGNCTVFADDAKERSGQSSRVVVISDSGSGVVYSISSEQPALEKPQAFELPPSEDGSILSLPQPVLDPGVPDRFGVVRISERGVLSLDHVWADDSQSGLQSAHITSFESGIKDPDILVASNDFAIVASPQSSQQLAIVNLRDGYVEHHLASAGKPISCVSLHSACNMVAIAYQKDVHILVPRWFESGVKSSWAEIRQLSIGDIGLQITGLAWLHDSTLSVATGHGLFFECCAPIDQEPDDGHGRGKSGDTNSALSLSNYIQTPRPVWHPSLIAYIFRKGSWKLAIGLLRRLHEKLTFWSEGDVLHPLLNVPAEQLIGAESMHNDAELDAETIDGLNRLLDEKQLPWISQEEQDMLKSVLETIAFCSAHARGLDNCALRYLFEWKLQVIRLTATTQAIDLTNGVPHDKIDQTPSMQWREISFAYQSTTQQPLLDILLSHYDNKITWPIANRLGITAWLNSEALEPVFEALAQTTYRSTSPPDPSNATLFFLALHKKPTLLALWRIATWHKEQRNTMKFLQRDFSQPEHRTAAKKNAYALLGKRRFDYAAAFFLLADDPASATSVLAGQCGEVMLAIAVARLYSGDGSSMLRTLLEDRILPDAEKNGDRWLVSWCHSTLKQRHQAAHALLSPLDGVRSWQQDDPDTMSLYAQLRLSESEYEWESVLRAARILRRMGLWLPALDLVRNWKFPDPQDNVTSKQGSDHVPNGVDHPSVLDEFIQPRPEQAASLLDSVSSPPSQSKQASSILDDFVDPKPAVSDKAAREAKAAELMEKLRAKKAGATTTVVVGQQKPKREPTQFKEPDANSLLDSFGF